jgi:hypothetical protein
MIRNIVLSTSQTSSHRLQKSFSAGSASSTRVGSPLARAELYVFLEEWLKHIPDFRLDPDHSPVTHSGSVNGMNSLYLRWD